MNSLHPPPVGKWDKDPHTDVHEFVEKTLHIDSYRPRCGPAFWGAIKPGSFRP